MKCKDFDANIDEILSGILHPEANQHAQQCERCNSHLRARTDLQAGLRKLAAASPSGPSRATDRAVMESYRRLQHRRAAWNSTPVSDATPAPRLLTIPNRSLLPEWASPRSWASRVSISRTWLSGAAAAAVVFAVFGSAVHLWTGVPTVGAPTIATAPAAPQPSASASDSAKTSVASNSAPRSSGTAARPAKLRSHSIASQLQAAQAELASVAFRSQPSEPTVVARASSRPAVAYAGGQLYDSQPVTQMSSNAAPVMRLASTGASGNVAQSASSTWPGYSNLMYCDPVICSGPMQVVKIKVPVGQVKPNVGQTVGNAFVNAEVVVGPDGVARAIRVAN